MASQLTLGILGGGQLGRMMAIAARSLGVKKIRVLDPDEACPCKNVVHEHVVGSFKKREDVLAFSKGCDVVTVEIEHVDTSVLLDVEAQGIPVRPAPSTIAIIQDKYRQKQHLSSYKIPLAEYCDCPTVHEMELAGQRFGYPFILKSKFGAYDGRGNFVVRSKEDIETAIKKLGLKDLYAEKMVSFTKELAVVVGRPAEGELAVYPAVETVHKDNICHIVYAPAHVSQKARGNAMKLARDTIATFQGAGVYAVEMFLLADDTTLVNEVAPRVHNSGHYTIEACGTSQFEQHIRAVLCLPLGDPSMVVPAACMFNVLGASDLNTTLQPITRALGVPGAHAHWYEKQQVKEQRKMGHVTIVGPSVESVRERLSVVMNERPSTALVPAAPVVGIIMGSDSDLPRMKPAAELLKEFGVPFEVNIVSAHRTPLRMVEYARTAHERGLRVIIAGAGGAAHLPGMVASMTPLPVVGVPVRIEPLNGEDALLSIVQMPAGVPVATVGVGNATNAALLAVRILGSSDPAVQQRMVAYQRKMEETVLNKAAHLTEKGWEAYSWPPK